MIFAEETSAAWWISSAGMVGVIGAAGHFLPKLGRFLFTRKKNSVAIRKAEMDLAKASFNTIVDSYQRELKRQEERITHLEAKMESLANQYTCLQKEHEECTSKSRRLEQQVSDLQGENTRLRARVSELEKKIDPEGARHE